jgi:hypothetical protein
LEKSQKIDKIYRKYKKNYLSQKKGSIVWRRVFVDKMGSFLFG